MLESILLEYNRSFGTKPLRIGVYPSPHVESVRERIRIDGAPISEEDFAEAFFRLWDQVQVIDEGERPFLSFFTFTTLLMFHVFLDKGVDCAIIETGIGGRGDPTNIVQHPHVTAITRLDLDHVSLLGNTIGEIAYHKGGIFKPAATALAMEQEPEGILQLRECAEAANVALGISKPLHNRHEALMGIPGDHQLSNAGLAVRIVEAWLQRNAPSTAMSKEGILPAFVEAGLRRATWPGRSDLQLTKDVAYFIDGAHTSESMRCAAVWYAKALPETSHSRTALIFNRTEDNKHELLRVLYRTLSELKDEANSPVFDLVIFCTNALTPQIQATPDLMSLNPVPEPDTSQQESLAQTWTALDSDRSEVRVVRSVAQAMEIAGAPVAGLRRDSKSDGVGSKQQHTACLVTGSLKLVGPCLTILRGGVQV